MQNYKTITVNHILGRLRSSSSSPFLVAAEDQNRYVIKNSFSGDNNFELLSDSLLSIIAKNCQIAVPEKVIVKFTANPGINPSLNNEDRDSIQQFVRHELLASRYLDGSLKLEPAVIDPRQASLIYHFDLYFIITDRRDKNLNLIIKNRRYYSVDISFSLFLKSISESKEINFNDYIIHSFILHPFYQYRSDWEKENLTAIKKSIRGSKKEIKELNQTLLKLGYFAPIDGIYDKLRQLAKKSRHYHQLKELIQNTKQSKEEILKNIQDHIKLNKLDFEQKVRASSK
jgi:hypothetical protein